MLTDNESDAVSNRYIKAIVNHISNVRYVSAIITRPSMVRSYIAIVLTSAESFMSDMTWFVKGGSILLKTCGRIMIL